MCQQTVYLDGASTLVADDCHPLPHDPSTPIYTAASKLDCQSQDLLSLFTTMIEVTSIDQLPVLDVQRQRTDHLCTYITAALAVIVFALACISFSPVYINKPFFLTDTEGRSCGVDLPQFPYLYQTSVTDPAKRLCVSSCPKAGDTYLHCLPTKYLSCKANSNPFFEVTIYDSAVQAPRLGAQCLPTNPVLRDQMMAKSGGLGDAAKYRAILNALKISAIFAVILGLIFFFSVQVFPTGIPRAVIGLGMIGLLVLALLTLFVKVDLFRVVSGFKIFFVVILILIALVLLYTLITQPFQLRLCSLLLKHAATIVLQSFIYIILYVITFLLATAAVFGLGYFQGMSFIGGNFSTPSIYGKFMFTVALFEVIWALFFLKEAYNLILSGYGINWYFSTGGVPKVISPLKNLLCFHWGSVAAGSFLTMVFWFPSLILHYIVPSRNESITSTSFVSKFMFQTCYGIQGLFDLCRTQAFAYINLTGVPYCNACRYVEYLSQNTGIYTGSKSINRIFLAGAHGLVLSICAVIGITYLQFTQRATSFYMVLAVILISYFFATYFLSLHCYIADGILVTLLTEEYLSGGFHMVTRAPPDLIQEAVLLMNKPVQL